MLVDIEACMFQDSPGWLCWASPSTQLNILVHDRLKTEKVIMTKVKEALDKKETVNPCNNDNDRIK